MRLVAFSGLAWNYKSSICDDLCRRDEKYNRIYQSNKDLQAETGNNYIPPLDLLGHWLRSTTNSYKEDKVNLSDRSPIDFLIYDLMMSPENQWFQQRLWMDYEFTDNLVKDKLIQSKIIDNYFSKFSEILIVSLTNSCYNDICKIFEEQPYSSTAYLFDNPSKYFYYSRLFNILSHHFWKNLIDLIDPTKIKLFRWSYENVLDDHIGDFKFKVVQEVYHAGIQ